MSGITKDNAKEQIRDWVKQNARSLMPELPLRSVELDHVAMCMHHIYRWYHEGYPLGDFLTSVVQNNFMEACFYADDVNRKVFYLYALFLANKIPFDYREKATGRTRKEQNQNDR